MYVNSAYINSQAISADPLELVRMLYRGALEGVSAGRDRIRDGDILGRVERLNKVSAIIDELTVSLDRNAGGEISMMLAQLYDYMRHLILTANIEQSERPLIELESLLGTILDGWENCRPAAEEVPVEELQAEYAGVSCSY
jgi:flagellar secretion chaperone FliS